MRTSRGGGIALEFSPPKANRGRGTHPPRRNNNQWNDNVFAEASTLNDGNNFATPRGRGRGRGANRGVAAVANTNFGHANFVQQQQFDNNVFANTPPMQQQQPRGRGQSRSANRFPRGGARQQQSIASTWANNNNSFGNNSFAPTAPSSNNAFSDNIFAQFAQQPKQTFGNQEQPFASNQQQQQGFPRGSKSPRRARGNARGGQYRNQTWNNFNNDNELGTSNAMDDDEPQLMDVST